MQRGLSNEKAKSLLAQVGPNSLPHARPTSLVSRFLSQFKSPIIWLLLVALVLNGFAWYFEGAVGIPAESIAIAAILLLNALLGTFQERRAEVALAKLMDLSAPRARVYRDGRVQDISSHEVVPGDVIRIEAGDLVPADGFLELTANALFDESMLTGESLPVDKFDGDEVFSGTRLVRGRAELVVSRTGVGSTLGRLATSLGQIQPERTPLERKVDAFGKQVAKWVMVLAASLLVGGVLLEGIASFTHILLFSVALAVAAVPEGMPAVLTLTLARGIQRMAARNAIVRRMSAVEALGSVTVICTDKTGTLTENKMEVHDIISDEVEKALVTMVVANDVDPDDEAGDPLELSLHRYAHAQGINPTAVRRAHLRLDTLPFDSSARYMRVTALHEGRPVHYFKGAPEALISLSDCSERERQRWAAQLDEAAASGYRLLGFAIAEGGDDKVAFLGFAKIWDPPRSEVPGAIKEALAAGVRVVMVTGDHPVTASAIAAAIDLPSSGVALGEVLRSGEKIPDDLNVFARVLPEEKLMLVDALQRQGEVVAMTGDGVNDAPALKSADVGVAMGIRGSDASREVADLVLHDDNFATIVAAIEQGRNIYANIQKFIRFLFSTNASLVGVVVIGAFGAVGLGLRDDTGALLVPLLAVQLLWINIVTDGPPALALGVDENHDVMRDRPRSPAEPLLDPPSKRFILWAGSLKAAIGLALLATLPWLNASPEQTRTALFHYLALAQLAFAYPSRGVIRRQERNWALALAVLLSFGLQVLVAATPVARATLGLTEVNALIIGAVLSSTVLAWSWAELLVRRKNFIA